MYITGTMKRNTKYIDKDVLFKKSVRDPRGFYNWSEDAENGVTQCCWMDREAVPFCSGGFGARTVGTDRSTSQQVEALAGSRKVKSKRMKSPHCSTIHGDKSLMDLFTSAEPVFMRTAKGKLFSGRCRHFSGLFLVVSFIQNPPTKSCA